MGTAQSKRTMSVAEDGITGSVVIGSHRATVHDASRANYDSTIDSDARRMGAGPSSMSRIPVDEMAQIVQSDVPESVNQLLQASLGDEPGLNICTLRHDSNAAELRRPADLKSGHNKLPTVFRWETGGEEVYVAGTFSHWKRIPLVKSRDNFYTICELAEGDHEYKYIVDGAWRCDDKVETKVTGDHTINNIIRVQKSDFEVFEALQNDVQRPASTSGNKEPNRTSGDHEVQPLGVRLGSPPGTYTKEIPSRRALELEPPPPALPPHLLQVLLNKDTAANVRDFSH